MDFKNYLDKMKEFKNNPPALTDLYFDMAHFYGLCSEDSSNQLKDIAIAKKTLIETNKSVAMADRMFEISELGRKVDKTKITLKALEKIFPAIKRKLQTFDMETKNQY